MIVLYALAGLAPIIAVLGVLFWLRFVRGDVAVATVTGSVAVGMAVGVLLGGAVTLVLVLLVNGIVHARAH